MPTETNKISWDMEENELFGEAHEQEENGLFGRIHEAEQLNLCGVVKSFVCPNGCGKNGDMGSCIECVGK